MWVLLLSPILIFYVYRIIEADLHILAPKEVPVLSTQLSILEMKYLKLGQKLLCPKILSFHSVSTGYYKIISIRGEMWQVLVPTTKNKNKQTKNVENTW